MDHVERLVDRFRTADATDAGGSAKCEIVVDLEERVDDPRVLALFVSIIADPGEYDLARIECMKILCLRPPELAESRQVVGRTIASALGEDDELVRQWAAMSLGPYADDDVVFEVLSTAVVGDEDLDVRHNVLSAVEEAGPTVRGIGLLRQLADDPDLGSAAARRLEEWA